MIIAAQKAIAAIAFIYAAAANAATTADRKPYAPALPLIAPTPRVQTAIATNAAKNANRPIIPITPTANPALAQIRLARITRILILRRIAASKTPQPTAARTEERVMKQMPIIRATTDNAAFIAKTDITKPKPTEKKHASPFRKIRTIAALRAKTASKTLASIRPYATMNTNAPQPNAAPIAE